MCDSLVIARCCALCIIAVLLGCKGQTDMQQKHFEDEHNALATVNGIASGHPIVRSERELTAR